ncbi:hypothetical protein Tco_1212050 [Tanacetum coccineum]
MLAEAQEAGQILDEEQLAFLADPGVSDGQAVQTIIPNNAAFQTENLDTYDSDCDDILNAQAVLMANISNYGSDIISEEKANKEQNNESVTAELERYKERVKTFEQRLNIDLSSREKMIDSQMDDMIKEKLALKEQVDSLEQNLSKQIKEKECLLQTFTVFKNESKEKEDKYMENEIDLEKKIKELDNILFKVGQSAQTVHIKPSDASPVKIEAPKELPKVILVNEGLKMLKFHLARFDNVVKIRTTPDARTKGEWGFEHTKTVFNNEIIPFLKSLKDIFNVFDRDLLNEIMENDLKAQLEDKDSTICKLKDMIKSMREKSKDENVKYDYCEIVTKNVELGNSVAKLTSENERLCNEINHMKQVFKEQFDSIKKTWVHTKEQSDSIIDNLNLKSAENEYFKAQIQNKVFVITSLKNNLQKLKGKEIVDSAAQTPSAHTIVPGMFKLDLEPLAPSQNQRDIPRDIPLDSVVVLRYEKRSKSEFKGRVSTEMELVLEQTQQGTSYEVSVSAEGVKELKRKVKINGEKKEALLTLRQKSAASTAAKSCQEDSSEFYLITGSIYTSQRGTMVIATIFDEVTKTLSSISVDYH